jgi:hypothetical protein
MVVPKSAGNLLQDSPDLPPFSDRRSSRGGSFFRSFRVPENFAIGALIPPLEENPDDRSDTSAAP